MSKPLTRRSVLKAGAGAALLAACSGGRAARAQRRPNIVYIMTDQQRADTLWPVGDGSTRADNLNALARQSTVFRNAYVTQPVCTPARSSLMTGLWPSVNGCESLNVPLRPEFRCLPEYLGSKYTSGYVGRWHLGDEIFPQHGFEHWVSIHDEYAVGYGPGRDRSQRSDYHRFLLDQGLQPDEDGLFSRRLTSRLPLAQCRSSFVEREAIDFLERNAEAPFALCVSFFEPHTPHTGPFDGLHRPEDRQPPPNWNAELGGDDPLYYRLRRERFIRSRERWARQAANYAGLIHQVDVAVGHILDKLEQLGLAENTIVMFTSDHGEMMGAHGLYAKAVLYEESVRVPLIVRVPGAAPRVVDEPVSHIDVLPTLLDLVGADPGGQARLQGVSLRPAIENTAQPDGDVFIQWNPHEPTRLHRTVPHTLKDIPARDVEAVRRASYRTIVTQDGWKLTLSDLDRNQLFDLNTDPHEMNNLYGAAAQRATVASLAERIAAWQQSTWDKVRLAI